MTRSRLALFFTLIAAVLCGLGYAAHLHAITWTQPSAPVTPQVQSANGAASSITATLTGSTGRMTYIEGFDLSGGGATAASIINVTVTGTANTLTYSVPIQAGVTAPAFGTGSTTGPAVLSVRFPNPIPASATNTNIVVTVPSFGSGNTQQSVVAYGFTQ